MHRWLSVLIIVSIISLVAHADSEMDQAEKIKAKLTEAFPAHTPDSVNKSPVNGLYEVIYGTNVIYVTEDARYIIEGVVLDMKDDNNNITEVASRRARKKFMTKVNELEFISFGSEKPKHTVTVFTDVDCGYCRKLHNEMDQYASYGIKVNYLMFPRNGLQSPSYTKSVSVWCSDDRKDALTRAKSGDEMSAENCDNPVADQYNIGRQMGVTGTPAILTEDGELMPGYLPAKQLAQRLDELADN